jgi:hypothetical protein
MPQKWRVRAAAMSPHQPSFFRLPSSVRLLHLLSWCAVCGCLLALYRCCAAVYFFLPARLPCPFLGGPLPVARASCTFNMRLQQQQHQQQGNQEQDSRQG